ncbi:MAG: agmatine deiminase family protein [Bacteroidaceae bacterium]|nr:agmatine deiminase family protein [Bacteroidaceae bacterium]
MAIHFKRPTPIISDLTLPLHKVAEAGPEQMELRSNFLPSEWFPQSGVQLTWPHAATDWAPLLDDVTDCYVTLAFEIASRELLLIVTPDEEAVRKLLEERLPSRLLPNIRYAEIATNDTWARDHAFITLITNSGPLLLNFRFNGWGGKFNAELDNAINSSLSSSYRSLFTPKCVFEEHPDFILEGGSIESDGAGTILTTESCLLADHRNQPLTKVDIEERLKRWLKAERIVWLKHGRLEGDDTDGHIDTLARFCPGGDIAYVSCNDPSDAHYDDLQAMEEELRQFAAETGRQLYPLPLPDAIADPDDGHRLPATYANFLVINNAVLMPTYAQPDNDERAKKQLQQAFPKHEIIGIDSRVLIRQHGSVHCSAMQYPTGALTTDL